MLAYKAAEPTDEFGMFRCLKHGVLYKEDEPKYSSLVSILSALSHYDAYTSPVDCFAAEHARNTYDRAVLLEVQLDGDVIFGSTIRVVRALTEDEKHRECTGVRVWSRKSLMTPTELEPLACLYPNQEWFYRSRLHRDDDLPAICKGSERMEWYQHGKRHRDGDQPAVVNADGSQEWWFEDKRHRDGGEPAVEYPSGLKMFYQHGELHRDGGKPAVVDTRKQEWWFHDQRHREDDRPALVLVGSRQEWWQHGQKHRDDDKPAVEHIAGKQEWWKHGKRHRDNDRPAVIHNACKQEWWQDGQLHRDNDKPARVGTCGREWRNRGLLHRAENKPAIVANSGFHAWYLHGKLIATKPACI